MARGIEEVEGAVSEKIVAGILTNLVGRVESDLMDVATSTLLSARH